MTGGGAATGLYLIVVWIAIVILAVVWICLPFAVFGIKPKIDEQTKLLREILAHLKKDEPVGSAQAETVGGTKLKAAKCPNCDYMLCVSLLA